MDWWQLVLALIVIAAYVVKHIMSAQQEQQAGRERAQSAPLRSAPTRTDEEVAREKTELDHRIEEAIERRRETEDKPVASPMPRRSIPMPAPTVVKPVPRYKPRVVPPPVPPQPAPVKVAVAVPAAARRPAPAVVVTAVAEPVRPVAPAARHVRDLLQDSRNLAAAVVLREILDRPLCLRRRRG